MHEVLVNRLEGLSLPRKSVVRLTESPDKTTKQQQQRLSLNVLYLHNRILLP